MPGADVEVAAIARPEVFSGHESVMEPEPAQRFDVLGAVEEISLVGGQKVECATPHSVAEPR